MEIKAKAKYLKISPQKVRLLIDHFKNKNPQKVLEELKLMPQKSAFLISKVLKSAISNAENNYNLKKDDLIISQIIVEEGPSYKRMKPRARGGRDIIKKRTSHITVILTTPELSNIKKKEEPKIKKEKEKPLKEIKKTEKKKIKEKPIKKEEKVVKKELIKERTEEKTKKEIKEPPKPQLPEKEKKLIKEKRPFFQRFFRRKGGM